MARGSSKPTTQVKYFPFNGGLDLVTPALSVDPGFALALVNYEPWFNGGYRRVDGYERYDGRAKPSAAAVYSASISSLVGLPSIGTSTASTGFTGTGSVSGATARFVEGVAVTVNGTATSYLALTNVSGTFGTTDKIISGTFTSTGTLTSLPSINFAPSGTGTSGFSYSQEFLANAQNYYRQQIGTVPGTGNVLGVWQNGSNIYAVRGQGGTNAALLYQASGTGWTTSNIVYLSTIYYNQLPVGQFTGTASVNVAGIMAVTNVGTGSVTTGMVMSDSTAGIPAGASVVSQLSGTTGGIGTYQLSLSPTAQVASELVTGINATVNIPAQGSVVRGVTSGATATLYAMFPQDTTVGYLALLGVTGTFQNGENLEVGSTVFAQASSVATQFSLPAGGFYRWRNYNFYANPQTYYTYVVNGQGPMFAIDPGNVGDPNSYVLPALFPQAQLAGQPLNNDPYLLEVYQNTLYMAFPGGVFQSTVPGAPMQWDGFLGANEFSTGAPLTGMFSMAGPALALVTARNTQILTGNNASNLVQTMAAEHAGGLLYGSTLLDTVYALNSLGITSLSRTQSYGNFVGSTVSQLVQPLVATLRPQLADCTIVRASNEARFYFSDGSVLIMYVPGLGQQNKAWSAIESGVTAQFGYASYNVPVFNICNSEDALNNEVAYFSSSNGDGYVYQDRSGTSWDGTVITSYIRTAFNNCGTPALRKYFRRADIELNALSPLALKFTADLSYSNAESSSAVTALTAANISPVNIYGGGGYWDSINWDMFDWDAQTISSARASLSGTGENISFLVFHQGITDTPFVVQGLVLHFDPRRYQR